MLMTVIRTKNSKLYQQSRGDGGIEILKGYLVKFEEAETLTKKKIKSERTFKIRNYILYKITVLLTNSINSHILNKILEYIQQCLCIYLYYVCVYTRIYNAECIKQYVCIYREEYMKYIKQKQKKNSLFPEGEILS